MPDRQRVSEFMILKPKKWLPAVWASDTTEDVFSHTRLGSIFYPIFNL